MKKILESARGALSVLRSQGEVAWKVFAGGLFLLLLFGGVFDVSLREGPRKFLAGLPGASSIRALQTPEERALDLQKQVLPEKGVVLPIRWGDLGKQMVDAGVIDQAKFEALYRERGGLDPEGKTLLLGESKEPLRMTAQNSGLLLNLLWAFGLANKNAVLDQGPMTQNGRKQAGNFASTGGWTIAKGDPMNYYSRLTLVTLTDDQQKRVEEVAKNIFRPCCGNSTYFPDCNHGMAMLGLLELMASQKVSEDQMYAVALRVNSYWFPDTYLTIAKYFDGRGVTWKNVLPKEILGAAYSSAQGYQQILKEVEPARGGGGGGCGV